MVEAYALGMEVLPSGGLIRDRLPEALEAEGYACHTRQAEGRELNGLLGKALGDAVQQMLINPSPENAAEALDLLEAAAQNSGLDFEEVKKAQASLREDQGTYSSTVLEALLPLEAPSLPEKLAPSSEPVPQEAETEMVQEDQS